VRTQGFALHHASSAIKTNAMEYLMVINILTFAWLDATSAR